MTEGERYLLAATLAFNAINTDSDARVDLCIEVVDAMMMLVEIPPLHVEQLLVAICNETLSKKEHRKKRDHAAAYLRALTKIQPMLSQAIDSELAKL